MVDVMSELMWSRVSGVLVLSFLVLMMLMLMSIVLIKSYLFISSFHLALLARVHSYISSCLCKWLLVSLMRYSTFTSLHSPWVNSGWIGLPEKKVGHDRFHTCFHAKMISSLGCRAGKDT